MRYVLFTLLGLGIFMVTAVEVSAQGPGGPRGPGGGKPSFDRLLGAFDKNEDKALEEDEVPVPVWLRLSQADANDDGYVTREEFDSYRPMAN